MATEDERRSIKMVFQRGEEVKKAIGAPNMLDLAKGTVDGINLNSYVFRKKNGMIVGEMHAIPDLSSLHCFMLDCAAAPLSGKAHCKSHPLPVDKEPPVKRKSAEDNPTMKSAKLAAASRALAALRTDDEDE